MPIGGKLTFHGFWNKVKSTVLATNVLVSTIDPDVGGLDFILWQFQSQITIQHFFVDQCIWRRFQSSRHLEEKNKQKLN